MSLPNTLSDITVDMVKNYFNYTDKDGPSRDAQIAAILPSTIDLITTYCRNDFEIKSRTYTPFIEPINDVFYTPFYPISSVTSVVERGNTLVQNTDYSVVKEIGRFRKMSSNRDGYYDRIYNYGLYWSTEPDGITVTYTAGTQLPGDVVIVFYELAGIYTQINQKIYTDINGQAQAVRYDAIPAELKAILDRYRKARTHQTGDAA